MNITKIENRINEINFILKPNDWSNIDNTTKLIQERNELEFKINKQNINIRLTGNNKYYYAAQCAKFTSYLKTYGFPYIDINRIKKDGISFNNFSINIGYSQYHQDLKRFNSKDEMLGFVIGFNEANSIK
tara:strand:- start:1363 stop:1752 length:390 start_codon:yes stop_codon:yes gene_type:complete